MTTAWERLTANSSLTEGTAFEHLNAQEGGEATTSIADSFYLEVDVVEFSLEIDTGEFELEVETPQFDLLIDDQTFILEID